MTDTVQTKLEQTARKLQAEEWSKYQQPERIHPHQKYPNQYFSRGWYDHLKNQLSNQTYGQNQSRRSHMRHAKCRYVQEGQEILKDMSQEKRAARSKIM